MLRNSPCGGDQCVDCDWLTAPVRSFLPWAGLRAGRTFLDCNPVHFTTLVTLRSPALSVPAQIPN